MLPRGGRAVLPRRVGSRWLSSPAHPEERSFYEPTGPTQLPPSAAKDQVAQPQTLTEKIVQQYSIGLPEGKKVRAGDYVTLSPHHCMTHDNSWPVALKFMAIGATKIHDKRQIVMTLDHDVQNKSETNLKKYRQIEEFATKQGVDFYPAGRGIGHQIMIEEGYAWPGTLAVASDSHSNMYGGIGCLGTPVVRTDAASIWATGKTWWQIPPIAKVTLLGTLPYGVTGKDVIVALCGLLNDDQVLNHAVEFTGSEASLASLPVDDRLSIANMTTEWGALSGLFPIDATLEGWLRGKATSAAVDAALRGSEASNQAAHPRFTHDRLQSLFASRFSADADAQYSKRLYLDLSTLSPYVSGPNSVKVATPVVELEAQDIKVDRAYLISCTNSRASDLAAAALVFKDAAQSTGKPAKIADHVSFYVAAASLPEQEAAEASGDWQILLDAGAIALPAGCGPCIGLGTGLLEPGEVGISASNRNFKGRMGSTAAKAYLGSPEVVAASALKGKICGPGLYRQPAGWSGVKLGEGEAPAMPAAPIPMSVEAMLEKVIDEADELISKIETLNTSETESTSVSSKRVTEVLEGFPSSISGEIVFCDADNINTDGIYPGKYTYQDGVTKEQMTKIIMENYDPAFASIAKEGDILVAGYNFGCGSSREQAATVILAKKIPLVVAGTFGNIFSRNSFNNGLLGIEVPKLVQRLRETFGSTPPTTCSSEPIVEPSLNRESLDSPPPAPTATPAAARVLTRMTGWTLTWDIRHSEVVVQEGVDGPRWTQAVAEMPANVQEIVVKGGLEGWVQAEMRKSQSGSGSV